MDESDLSSLAGWTALVEAGGLEATGVVSNASADAVLVVCDEQSWKDGGFETVQVSVFAPDALYRFEGASSVNGLEITVGPIGELAKISRRRWPRRRLDMPATVCPVEDGRRLAGVPGRTVDIGVGGVCIETLRQLEGEGDPMIILNLPDGTTVVSLTTTVAVEDLGDGWRYRFAFLDLDHHDRGRLALVIED